MAQKNTNESPEEVAVAMHFAQDAQQEATASTTSTVETEEGVEKPKSTKRAKKESPQLQPSVIETPNGFFAMKGLEHLEIKPFDRDTAMSQRPARKTTISWSQQRRLDFIDFRLKTEGRVNRSDLVVFFNISIPQVSADFARYMELCRQAVPPRKNIVYNPRAKCYVRAPDFKPLFPNISSPVAYLSDLLALSKGRLQENRNYFGFVPAVGVASFTPPRRNIDNQVLYSIIEAISKIMVVHIVYNSVSSKGKHDYIIAPHALAYDGLRWHVRAYSYEHHCFRDFVLSRILQCSVPDVKAPSDRFPDPSVNGFTERGTKAEDDTEWNEQIDLVLKANPELPEPARRAIERDYGMGEDGTVVYTCRKAMAFYVLRWLRLSEEYDVIPPTSRQIVLDNDAEVRRRLNIDSKHKKDD